MVSSVRPKVYRPSEWSTGLMGEWDDGDGFSEVPLGPPAAAAPKKRTGSSSGGSGTAEARKLQRDNAELLSRLKAAETVRIAAMRRHGSVIVCRHGVHV